MIYHITARADYDRQRPTGLYRAASLDREGFIHASWHDQITSTADRIFHGRSDLVILCIEEARLDPELVLEDTYGHGAYPHLYGPLNLSAVAAVIDFPSSDDGSFILPFDLP